MKVSIVVVGMLFYPLFSYCQKQAAIWYFGDGAGLNFREGSPSPIFDGQLFTREGSAVISDEDGNLLFYTDGVTVWDKNHTPMPSGEGLKGSFTSTQSALIVPQPGSDRYFYIFTTAYQAEADGLNYSLVDITLNNGGGDVVLKNQQLYTPTTEKLAAAFHANGRDVWVVTHRWESDEFYTYLITADGLQEEPVISKAGIRHEYGSSNERASGPMKISPKGDKLALLIVGLNVVEVFDFSTITGTVANPIHITGFEALPYIYGLEFSPNGRYIYVSEHGNAEEKSKLFRFNLSSNRRHLVVGSKEIIAEEVYIRSMQLGPDYKIYIAIALSGFLASVDNPNDRKIHYTHEALNLSPMKSSLGLPNFISTYFLAPDPVIEFPNAFSPNKDCINDFFEPMIFNFVSTFHFNIVDRDGKSVYSSDSSAKWSGENAETGVYFWSLEYSGINGAHGVVKGWVNLIR